jgi:hypothetical protein
MENDLKFLYSHYDSYDDINKIYSHKRGAGLFSQLNWVIRMVSLLELKGYSVNEIQIFLEEYMSNVDVFNSIFNVKSNNLNLKSLPESQKNEFETLSMFSNVGLSENPKNLNLSITNQIISKFFNPSPEVIEWYNNFINHLGVDNKDIIFIWARRTDKQSESKIPTVDTYLDVLSKINCDGKKILIQTDDQSVLDEFKNKDIEFLTLPQIPFSQKKDFPFHINMNFQTNEDFNEMYGISKIDHIRQMVALVMIAKNAYKSIIYPGNPTTFIPLFKGSFDDCILFKDDINLF